MVHVPNRRLRRRRVLGSRLFLPHRNLLSDDASISLWLAERKLAATKDETLNLFVRKSR